MWPLWPHDAARQKQCVGGTHRRAHAWDGRGSETETAGAATHQVKVVDLRNPRYNATRRLAVGKFMTIAEQDMRSVNQSGVLAETEAEAVAPTNF
jgi:hypothetical protein